MDVTSTSRWLIVVVAACASLFVGACTDPRIDAAGAIEAELAARKARSARSAELCGKGLEAFERSDLPQARGHLEAAIDEDVDVIGVSYLSGEHLVFTPKIVAEMKKNHLDDVLLVAGGTFPVEDIPPLEEMGIDKVFRAGSLTNTIVQYIEQNVKR